MNLRERVLESWQSYKEKMMSFKKGVMFLTEQYEKSTLPAFPVNLNDARNKLDSWTSYEYLTKVDNQKNRIWTSELLISEHLSLLGMSLTDTIQIFKDLTQGWKKEKDSYARYRNSPNDGPTIHDVDDW